MAEKGIFLDVLPRFDMAATSALISKVQGVFNKAGKEIGGTFGTEAEAGLRRLQGELTRAETRATTAYNRMAKSAGDAQVAEARYNELRAKNLEATSARMIAAENRVSNARRTAAAEHATYVAREKEAEAARAASMEQGALIAGAGASKAKAALNGVGAASTVATAAIGIATGQMAGHYESAGTRIKVATRESAKDIKELQDGLLKLGPEVGYKAQDLLDSSYIVAKAGFKDAGDQLQILKAGAQLARTEGVGLEEAMNGLTTTLVDFHIPASQVADVATQFQVAFGNAKAPIDALMGSLHNFEPTMKLIAGHNKDPHAFVAQTGAILAQATNTGMSADQASQNINNTLLHLIRPNQPQSAILGSLGLNPDDLSKQLNNPEVGPLGVMKKFSDAVAAHTGPDGNVTLDAMFKSSQLAENMKVTYEHLSAEGKAWADSIKQGTLSAKDMKDLRLQEKLEPALRDWDAMHQKIGGVNPILKKNQDLTQSIASIFKQMTGTDQGMRMFAAAFGDKATSDKTMQMVEENRKAHADSNGDVEHAAEVMNTYQGKVDAAKASVHSLGIEVGQVFLPYLKSAADVLKNVTKFLGDHENVTKGAVIALGTLAAAWASVKTAMAIGSLIDGIKLGFSAIGTAGQSAFAKVTGSATTANAAIGTNTATAAAVGATGVETAAAREVAAQNRVVAAANRAMTALRGVAGLAGSIALTAGLTNDNPGTAGSLLETAGGGAALGYALGGPAGAILGGGGGVLADMGRMAADAAGAQREHQAREAKRMDEYNANNAKAPQPGLDDFLLGAPSPSGTPGAPPKPPPGPTGSPLGDMLKNAPAPPPGLPGPTNPELNSAISGAPVDDGFEAPSTGIFPGGGGGGGKDEKEKKEKLPKAPEVAYDTNLPPGIPGMQDNATTFSSASSFLDARHKLAEKQARLDQLEKSSVATEDDILKAKNDVIEATRDYQGSEMRLSEARKNQYEQMVKERDKLQKDILGTGSSSVGGFWAQFGQKLGEALAMLPFGGLLRGPINSAARSADGNDGYGSGLLSMIGLGGSSGGYGLGGGSYGLGGRADAMISLAQSADGGKYGWGQSDLSHGLADCSGAVSDLVEVLTQGHAGPGRLFSTGNEGQVLSSLGFTPGYVPGQLNIGFKNGGQGGGHTAATLPNGVNFESGGSHGGIAYGGPAAGALSPQFTDHYTMPVGAGTRNGGIYSPASAGVGGPSSPLADLQSQGYTGGGGEGPVLRNPATSFGAPGPGPMNGAPSPGVGNGIPQVGQRPQSQSGSRQPGQGLPSSEGIGITPGGAVDMAGQAAATAANAFAPGSGIAVQKGMQLGERAMKFGGQLIGIGAEGLLETFGLNDSAIGDPSKSWFGRVAQGIGGVKAATDNTAGKTEAPLKPDDQKPGQQPPQGPPAPLVNIEHQENKSGDGGEAARDTARTFNQYQGGGSR